MKNKRKGLKTSPRDYGRGLFSAILTGNHGESLKKPTGGSDTERERLEWYSERTT